MQHASIALHNTLEDDDDKNIVGNATKNRQNDYGLICGFQKCEEFVAALEKGYLDLATKKIVKKDFVDSTTLIVLPR